MPLYLYRCSECEAEVEVHAKMSDPPPTRCEACGAAALERRIGRTAFALKGGGWYAQGYSKGGAAKAGAAKAEAAAPSAS
ncbi:zinc ribbon domain-containing protein [Myxococcota bacterium]|nr:zinc ribbon domain-containing protein [Myxococcota bacterium]MBU1431593.1 zinc ribbon domain-containing protein [Myxococcota bacterium]MBU1900394.1 zinc ribbon domain-containing protein [Myxococcota bacterium]